MEASILLASLLVIVAFSSAIQTASPLVKSDKPEPLEEKSQRDEKESVAKQQMTFLEFLSGLDEVQKSTNPIFISKTPGLQAYAKMFGRTIKKDQLEAGQSGPPISQQDGVAASKKDLQNIYPFSGRNFRKAIPQSSKKAKKRACFWKYCVQSK